MTHIHYYTGYPCECTEWVEDPKWYALGSRGVPIKCSFPRCPNRAVAIFQRHVGKGIRDNPYCGDHLYGRRLRDGIVECRECVYEPFDKEK